MKKILALLLLSGSAYAQQSAPYAAGIWLGEQNDPAALATYSATLTVLPNGAFWGFINDQTMGAQADVPGCPYMAVGTLWKDLVIVALSAVDGSGPSACAKTPSVWGTVKITKTSATTATWVLTSPLLTKTFNLTLFSVYNQPSSLKTISGFWGSDSYTEIVTPSGAFISFNQVTGCIGSGQYTVVDATHNLYSLTETLYNCDSSTFNGARNGVAFVQNISGETASLNKQSSAGMTNIYESSAGTVYYGH
jgi:hypothetical protein